MEPSECRRCDDYGVLDTGDWLTRPKPCPDCALGKAEAAERERDEQARATGAAFRRLVESGIHHRRDAVLLRIERRNCADPSPIFSVLTCCDGWVEGLVEEFATAPTLPEAVDAALAGEQS